MKATNISKPHIQEPPQLIAIPRLVLIKDISHFKILGFLLEKNNISANSPE